MTSLLVIYGGECKNCISNNLKYLIHYPMFDMEKEVSTPPNTRLKLLIELAPKVVSHSSISRMKKKKTSQK